MTENKSIKVLFVGNSHTYMNDMPQLFRETWERTTGGRAEVTMLAFSGRHLRWHLSEYFSLRFALLYGGYDYCVIQQAAHPFPPREETLADGRELIDLCRRTGVEPVLYMTWAEKRFPENQEKMIETYRTLAGETSARLAPVGEVWQELLRTHPEIDLFFRDGEHASPYGDLLIAAVLCAAIAGSGDVRLPEHVFDFGLDVSDPEHLAARLDRAEIAVPVDPDKAEAIRLAVAARRWES